jgi:hypothetical protein
VYFFAHGRRDPVGAPGVPGVPAGDMRAPRAGELVVRVAEKIKSQKKFQNK